MIMGDNPESAVLVRTANDIGLRTVVVGINRNTEPKIIAAKSYDVNALDVSELEKIAISEKIDGVIVGVADILMPAYTELCGRLNVPCYSTPEAVKFLSHKSLFKQKLASAGLPVIPEYQEYTDYQKIPLPVFVKPVDNGGGVGISSVYTYDKLQSAIEYAYSCSHTHTIQIEKLMTGDIVACYYTIINGRAYLSSLEDNLFTRKQPAKCPITTGHLYASRYLPLYLEKYHEKVCAMLKNVHAENGILQINAFVENDELYFYDPGYRLQGEAQHHILKYVNGFDHKAMLCGFAMSGKMYEGDFQSVNDPFLHGKACASLWVLLREGRIGSIQGLRELLADKRVIFNGQRFFEGDTVEPRFVGTEKQVFSRIYLVAENREDLRGIVSEFNRNLKITDENGGDMIVDMLRAEDIG